ncbi:MAG: hypothetical protein ACXWWU_10030 [Candidatus Limnocylindria bacterium]
MSAQETDEPRLSAFALARRLVSGLVALARLEVRHGLQEVGGMIADARGAMVLIGIAIGATLLSVVTLDVVIILGVAALFAALPNVAVAIIIVITFVAVILIAIAAGAGAVTRLPWFVLLIILIVAAAVIAAFALPAYLGFKAAWHAALFVFVIQLSAGPMIAWRAVRRIKIGPPADTIASVREEVAWAKRLIRRG